MPQRQTKQWVEAILYGSGSQRRFTHDSPIQLDVWAQYFERPSAALDLLLVPWLDTAPVEASKVLQEAIGEAAARTSRISYNRRVVAAQLTLLAIVDHVLPLIGWYNEVETHDPADSTKKPRPIALPDEAHLWDDVDCANMTRAVQDLRAECGLKLDYGFPQLLSFVRMAGLVLDRLTQHGGEPALDSLFGDFIGESEARFKQARDELTRRILRGWRSNERTHLPAPAGQKLVHSITRNRPARLALYQSVRTVKADAASALFTIDCGKLTWAVMDSGIDAAHPAFRIDPTAEPPKGAKLSELLRRSRVKETYDFSYLRDLLVNPKNPKLPPHVKRTVDAAGETEAKKDALERRNELLRYITQSRSIDWDQLKPFLRVEHGDEYPRPIDTHGTHVGGILGGKWREPGAETEWMTGLCPDIRIIDIRVCRREDGSSDEFVIMSALQFIRHLNSSSDRMAVHGVNMSLSLDHDAAVYACGRTPICEEAERTVASGVVVVAAAGNLGYRRVLDDGELPFDQYCPVSITDPGNAENVITVGATHRGEPHNYGVSYFSSRGPTGDGRIKPDLVAPGEKIYAPALGDSAVRLDGTSMAAPHVSGAAAMLMARHTELIGEPQRVKHILCRTATDLGRERYFQGHGLVDVLRAIQSV